MASGHVNRINRPNTWLHRPAKRREDFSCRPGAVHTWARLGLDMLRLSSSGRNPSGLRPEKCAAARIHLGPFSAFGRNERAELGRRRGHRQNPRSASRAFTFGSASAELISRLSVSMIYLWIGERRVDLAIERLDDLGLTCLSARQSRTTHWPRSQAGTREPPAPAAAPNLTNR